MRKLMSIYQRIKGSTTLFDIGKKDVRFWRTSSCLENHKQSTYQPLFNRIDSL